MAYDFLYIAVQHLNFSLASLHEEVSSDVCYLRLFLNVQYSYTSIMFMKGWYLFYYVERKMKIHRKILVSCGFRYN